MSGKSVTVIGNGIVGLCIARALLNDGYAVTVIDRTDIDEGTSIGNAGAIATAEVFPIAEPGIWKRIPGMLFDPLGPLHLRLGHIPRLMPWMYRFLQACSPENYRRGIDALAALLLPALADHADLRADIGAERLISGEGALFVYRTERGRDRDAQKWRMAEDLGIDVFPLNRDGVLQHEPGLGPEARFGVYTPNWAFHRDPLELLQIIKDHLRARDVKFETGEVTSLVRDGSTVRQIMLADGRMIEVENLVIAAGAWSGELSKELGEPFPIEADRGYNTTLPSPGIDMKNFVTYVEDSIVSTPMSMGLRIGGAVEMGGLSAAPNYKRSEALLTVAKRYLPNLDDTGGTQWMGHRPGTPDSIPVISKSANADNVVYAFGHGHLGLSTSATTAKLVAAMIGGREPEIDVTPYRIDRYR